MDRSTERGGDLGRRTEIKTSSEILGARLLREVEKEEETLEDVCFSSPYR